MKRYGISILLSLMMLLGQQPLYHTENEKTILQQEAREEAERVIARLHAESAVLMDADTGRVLLEKSADKVRPMASTTKIMTCILALEYGNPEDIVTVSAEAARQPKVHLGATAGRRFYLKDLLYSLMLESHNDTAVMIAEHIGGSVEGFTEQMNRKARELGCENTCFLTPNGLDASETTEQGERIHATTAKDLAKIMGYCVWQSPMKEEFLKITGTQNHYFTDVDGKTAYSCTNHNAWLTMERDALSGKTGFTAGAGYSYVAAMESEGRHFTLALLGCGWPPHKTYKWEDTRRLYNYGKNRYQNQKIEPDVVLPVIPVEHGISEQGDLAEEATVSLIMKERDTAFSLLMQEGEQVKIRMNLPEKLTAPVQEMTVVGSVDYLVGDWIIRSCPVYAKNGIEEIHWKWCVKKIADIFFNTM